MIAKRIEDLFDVPRPPQGVEELSLMLPAWQVSALAATAESEGLTVAQFLRRLVNRALEQYPLTN
jgi:hypothetical protein